MVWFTWSLPAKASKNHPTQSYNTQNQTQFLIQPERERPKKLNPDNFLISIISLEHLQRWSVCDSHTVKFIAKRSKCAGLAQEIGFPAPNSCSLLWLVKGATQLCTSRKTCNKLHLTVAQYFWLVDHNDWSRWLAISSSPCIYSSGFKVYWWGWSKKINS